MQKWEYLSIEMTLERDRSGRLIVIKAGEQELGNKPIVGGPTGPKLQEYLSQRGDEGWELIATIPAYIFKRPKLEN